MGKLKQESLTFHIFLFFHLWQIYSNLQFVPIEVPQLESKEMKIVYLTDNWSKKLTLTKFDKGKNYNLWFKHKKKKKKISHHLHTPAPSNPTNQPRKTASFFSPTFIHRHHHHQDSEYTCISNWRKIGNFSIIWVMNILAFWFN